MYDCGQEVIDLFNRNYRQIVRVHFEGGGRTFDISEEDIVSGGLTIDRYCVSGSKVEVGSAIAAELALKLKNYDGQFDEIPFEGADLFVQVGIKKWDAGRWENAVTHWVPCGHFIIDTPPRTLSTISISALDRMVKFDRAVDLSRLSFPMHIDALVQAICTICGVSLYTDVSALPNSQYSVGSLPSSDSSIITYRQVLQWCAAITGTCAFIDADGQLVLKWYEPTDVKIRPSERYSSDMYENDIAVTGFTFTDTAGNNYMAGTSTYTLDLSNCALLTNNQQGVLTAIYNARQNFSYRPYQAVIKPAPYLYPLDRISYTDAKGIVHDTIVTNITFTLNKNTSIAGSGETITNASYAGSSGMTFQQSVVVSNLQNRVEVVLSEQTLSARDLSQLTANALGLNVTILTSASGVMSYYFHDGKTFADSNIIYTLLGGTFAWTTDYNDGNPVWNYGYTQESSAILRSLLLYQITSDYIADGSITEDSLDPAFISKIDSAISHALTVANQYTDTVTTDTLTLARNYADAQDISVLSSAKSYTDEVASTTKEYVDVQTTAATTAAGEYTDRETAAVKTSIIAQIQQALSDAKEYSDTQNEIAVQSANQYTDEGIESVKEYADTQGTVIRQAANLYTDSEVNAVREYIDTQDAANLETARQYTDETGQVGKEYTDTQKAAVMIEIGRVAPLLYMQGSDGELYIGVLRCVDGKPQFEYERSE